MTDLVTHRLLSTDPDAARLFAGPGEMRTLCRAFDWSTTSLGPVASWPISLCTQVRAVMAARCPAFLWLGPDLVQIFNDAYRPSLGEGDRHRIALGANGREFWAEIWSIIGSQIEQVLAGGDATWHEDQLVPITRNGRVEDVFWTYGYSAVFADDGAIAGVLVLCQETTSRVIAEREQARLTEGTARAERRAARILDRVNDEHLTMDADFRILSLNDAAVRNLGVQRERIIGHTHWEAFPASVGTPAEVQYRRAMAERAEIHFTHRYVGEGYDRHLEIDVYPTDDGGLALFWREVTTQAQAERALRDLGMRYRTLVDSIDAGFAVVEVLVDEGGVPVDYRFVEANAAFAAHTGLELPVGRTIRALVPEIEPFWIETYGRVAATGESIRFQHGSDVMGRMFDVFALRVGAAADRHVALLFTDITAVTRAARERDALLATLAVERARLEDIVRIAPAFMAVLHGPSHVFTLTNAVYDTLVGGRQVRDLPVTEALPEVVAQGFVALLDQVLETGDPFIGREVPYRRPDAAGVEDVRYVDFVFQALSEADGSRSGIFVHGVDVTEPVLARRQVERLLAESEVARGAVEDAAIRLEASDRAARRALDELEATYRTAPVGLAVVDTALRFQRVNARLAEMNGPSVDAHLGRTVREIVPALADDIEPRLWAVLETGRAEFNVMVSGETSAAPGVVRHWVEQWLPLHDRAGTVIGISIVAEEVTDRRHAEAERDRLLSDAMAARAQADQARIAAETANQAKADFLAIMSHELRTPLNAIGGYAELIEMGVRGPVTAEQRADLARIQKSQRHLLGLINGVLNFAKLDAGAVDFAVEEVALHEVIGVCELLILPQLRSKGLTLDTACNPAAPTVRADREKVQQVLLNLLSNALKFTGAGGSIAMSCDVDATEHVVVRVTDTGRGIAADQLERIFQPFVQVDVALTRGSEGTGLGLSISRDLARGMGGDLTVESVLGAGTTFIMRLPRSSVARA